MKKNFVVFICLIMFFVSGCTQNYKDVSDYYDKVFPNWKLYKDLVITGQAVLFDDIKVPINYKQCGKKWVSDNALYDGTNFYAYKDVTNNSIVKTTYVEWVDHPLAKLINWKYYLNGAVLKKNTHKNGMQCRMIETYYDGQQQLCISDKYGIAIYYEGKDSISGGFKYEITSIKEEKISDEAFKLPSGIKVKIPKKN